MTIDPTQRLDPLAGVGTAPPITGTEANDPATFRRLLESLEKMAAEHRDSPPIDDTDGVDDAVRKADEGYTLAMDLRRKLEDAFRQRMP